MLAKTSLCIDTKPDFIQTHLGIPPNHPELLQARSDFQDRDEYSIILIAEHGDTDTPQIVRLVDDKRVGFSDTKDHEQLVQQLSRVAGTPLLDREIFTTALQHLLLQYTLPCPNTRRPRAPVEPYCDACFQLLFDYAPGSFCIAATSTRLVDKRAVQIRYSKFAYGDTFGTRSSFKTSRF